MPNGTVKFFNDLQGFGLISPDTGPGEIFVHVSALERAGIEGLRHGQRVAYNVELDRHGRAAVRSIEMIADVACRAPGSPRQATADPGPSGR
jgi:CspA family cold shock protein